MATGEGSRGGHIIGHTKSGKPIYGDARDTAAKVEKGKPHTEKDSHHGALKKEQNDSQGRTKKWENTYHQDGETYIAEGFQKKDQFTIDLSRLDEKTGKFNLDPNLKLTKKLGK